MPTDTDDLEHMRDLGINYVMDTVRVVGQEQTIRLVQSFMFGVCQSLCVLDGDRKHSEFLYVMADHFAVHGMSADDFERIGHLIKTATHKS